MTCHLRLPLCCAVALVASLASTCPAAGPYPTQAPTQAPVQAPLPPPMKVAPPQVVTRTIMVPHTTYKTITIPGVVCQPEVRQKTVTVCRSIPETTFETCVENVMVPERRFKTVNYSVCRMEFDTVTKPITVMVSHPETRQGIRTVCKPVQTQEMRTICKDLGQWTSKSYVDCYGCEQACQIWLPNVVTEQVPVTVWKPQFSEEPYTYTDIVCRPETREVTERIPRPVYETKTREVAYLVPVPKQVERRVPRTTFRQVTEEKLVNYTVMVPHRVERQIQVPVCTMVPKQISVPVHSCPPCDRCGW